jgi:hypothetical protein
MPKEMAGVIGVDYQQKLSKLAADIPKPVPNIRGKAYETLSSDDLRLANAMWEATTKPLSIFEDFSKGAVDYDKVQYAWAQYPGLQQAAQVGLLDLMGQLTESDKAGIPDPTLTQLDNLLGFGGTLQPTLAPDFVYRIGQMTAGAQQEQGGPSGGSLDLPTTEPTFTNRIANGN